MSNKKFSGRELAHILLAALMGYLANIFGLVNLPLP